MKEKLRLLENETFVGIVLSLLLLSITSLSGDGLLGPLFKYVGFKLVILLTILFFVLSIYKFGFGFFFVKENYVGILAFAIYVISYITFNNKTFSINYLGFMIMSLVVYNIFRYVIAFENNRKLLTIVLFSVLIELLLIIVVSDYYLLTVNKKLIYSRAAFDDTTIKEMYEIKSLYMVGNFATAHVAPIVLMISIFGIIKNNRLFYFPAILSFVIVICGNNFIPLASLLLVAALAFFIKIATKHGLKLALLFTILLLSLISLAIYFLYLFDIDFVFKGKIDQIIGYVNNEHKLIRLEVYKVSIKSIINNKLLYIPSSAQVGMHSSILDNLAVLGVLSIPFFSYNYLTLKKVVACTANKLMNILVIVYIVLINLLNPMCLKELAVAIYIIYPFSMYLIASTNKMNARL